MELTKITDINNLIFKNILYIRDINIDNINNNIKNIFCEKQNLFNYKQKTLWYNNDNNNPKLIIIICCKKCGNYMNNCFSFRTKRIICKCNNYDNFFS